MKKYYECFKLFPILNSKLIRNVSDIGCGGIKLPLIGIINNPIVSMKLYDLDKNEFLSPLDLKYSEGDLKNHLPNYSIRFTQNAQVEIDSNDKIKVANIVSPHFIELDIEDFKSYNKIDGDQDLIHCRFVLHFKKFDKHRFKIIKMFTNKLKVGGFLYLSFYNDIPKDREGYSEYKLMNHFRSKVLGIYLRIFYKIKVYKSLTYNDKMERIYHLLIERL